MENNEKTMTILSCKVKKELGNGKKIYTVEAVEYPGTEAKTYDAWDPHPEGQGKYRIQPPKDPRNPETLYAVKEKPAYGNRAGGGSYKPNLKLEALKLAVELGSRNAIPLKSTEVITVAEAFHGWLTKGGE